MESSVPWAPPEPQQGRATCTFPTPAVAGVACSFPPHGCDCSAPSPAPSGCHRHMRLSGVFRGGPAALPAPSTDSGPHGEQRCSEHSHLRTREGFSRASRSGWRDPPHTVFFCVRRERHLNCVVFIIWVTFSLLFDSHLRNLHRQMQVAFYYLIYIENSNVIKNF